MLTMSAAAVPSPLRAEFAPPEAPGFLPSAAMALLVHVLLLAALTLSVQWKHQTSTPAIEAEIWSATALQAAAKDIEPPVPEPAPEPQPLPKPVKTPPPAKVAPPPSPVLRDAQIALERQKAKEQALAEERQARELAERKRKDELKKRELEKQAQEEKDKQKRDKLDAEKKQAEKEKAKKREADAKLAAEKEAAQAKADKAKAAASKAEADARYKAQMERVMGLAGASGDAKATGTALKSSGPSASYNGRIIGRVKPNIVFTDDLPGNPEAVVEFRTAPDGTIVGTPKLIKSSGVKAWDEAVINAILKTEVVPRDTDGRVPPVIQMGFKPKDVRP